MNIDATKYWQAEFNNRSERSYTMSKSVLSQDGSTYINP
jgi:hypothetical protein